MSLIIDDSFIDLLFDIYAKEAIEIGLEKEKENENIEKSSNKDNEIK